MRKHRKKWTAGNDLISELPDEILHSILRRLSSSREAALTTVLSRRWRSPWRSYPFVEFDLWDLNRRGEADEISSTASMAQLEKFGDAAFDRFSRDKLLLMKTLKVLLEIGDSGNFSGEINQLLGLASKRKAEEIAIIVTSYSHRLSLHFGCLSNSTARTLRFKGIDFIGGRLPLSLNSLRFVHLDYVELEDSQLLANLIASSPILETLILRHISKFTKLQICNTTSLKTLKVSYCWYLEEIEIAAAGLQTLITRGLDSVSRIELLAPQLAVLKMVDLQLMGDDILLAMVSKLKSLKSLTLGGLYLHQLGTKLKLSIPNLEEFTLWAPLGLEEVELDSMPCLSKFFLHCNPRVPDEVKIFEVGSAPTAATNEWKVDFSMSNEDEDTRPWFVGLKNFIATFTQFNTANILCCSSRRVTFEEEEEVDNSVHPRAIEHLKIDSELLSSIDQRALFDGLFWACRPRFLTIVHYDYRFSEKLTEVFFDLTSKYLLQRFSEDGGEGCDGHRSWLHQLKDVKMIMRDNEMVKKYVQEEADEGEEEYDDDTKVRTCFELTWCTNVL